MTFIRRSLTNKSLTLFTVLTVMIVTMGIYLNRSGIEAISTHLFFTALIVLLVIILAVFLVNVIRPLNRVIREIRHLLMGKNYKRVLPTTIDEIGIMTNFFNEITKDLEKISYDIKERRRMSSELDIAAKIQKDVLPKEAPEAPGLDIVAKTRTASEVGGDTFDFLSTPDGDQIYVYIGDVTGHGVPAGLVMMMVDTLVTTMVTQGVSNGKDLVVNTNALLTPRISARLFMTTVMLRWDKPLQKMFYTGAGHEHIVLYRANGETVETIPSGGIALGMIPDNSKIAQEKEIPMEVGDAILLFTDGITEAKNATGEMYGLERLQKALQQNGYRPTESLFDNLTKDFSQFVGEYVQADDITMIVIKRVDASAPASKIKLTVNTSEPVTQSKMWNWTG